MKKLRDGYPVLPELIKNERKTLAFIGNQPLCHTHYRDLGEAARRAFDSTRGTSTALSFEGTWDVLWQNRWLRIFAGVIVVGSTKTTYDQVSYCLAVCDAKNADLNRLRLVRKFHFDYDPDRNESPTFHMQYAGKATPALKGFGVHDKYLFPWFESPRIPSSPMSLAILLHLGFTEFPDEDSHKFIERSAWRDLVGENEEFMLRWFYKFCHNHFDPMPKHNTLLMDRFYE